MLRGPHINRATKEELLGPASPIWKFHKIPEMQTLDTEELRQVCWLVSEAIELPLRMVMQKGKNNRDFTLGVVTFLNVLFPSAVSSALRVTICANIGAYLEKMITEVGEVPTLEDEEPNIMEQIAANNQHIIEGTEPR